jgi:hypothetical protein
MCHTNQDEVSGQGHANRASGPVVRLPLIDTVHIEDLTYGGGRVVDQNHPRYLPGALHAFLPCRVAVIAPHFVFVTGLVRVHRRDLRSSRAGPRKARKHG